MARASQFVVLGSIVVLVNAALDGIHYREYLHASHQAYSRPPVAVVAQCVLAFFACTWGIVSSTPKLKPIRVTGSREMKNFDYYSALPAFVTFNHRSFR